MDLRRRGGGRHHGPNRTVDDVVGLALIIGAVVVGYRILLPLMPAILWGGSLAVICAHPFEALARRMRGARHLAAAVFALIFLFALICPAFFFAWELLRTAPALLHFLQAVTEDPGRLSLGWLTRLPLVGPDLAERLGTALSDAPLVDGAALRHLGHATGWAVAQVGSFGAFVFQFALGAVVALFLLVHRSQIRGFAARVLSRVGGDFAEGIVANALHTMRTAFFGVVVAATAQALLAAAALWLAGLPGVILFTGLTFLAALIQLGPVVTLLIADAILIARGDHLAAVLVTLWFLGVVMTVDNVIKPYFARRGAPLPGLLAFLGGIGGILAWGLIGAYLGPALMSVLYQLALAWGMPEHAEPADAALPPQPRPEVRVRDPDAT